MGTAAPKHFQYSAFCFVTRGAVTKRLRHLQPLIRISRRGEEETCYTGWEICVTRKQFCRNFPWNFTRISAPCPGFCQMMPRFARKYGSSGLAVVSLLSFVDLVGFGVFFCRMHRWQGAAVGPRGFWVTLSTCLWFLSAELISLDGAPYTLRSVTIFTFPFPAAKGPAFSCKHHLSSRRGTQ